MTRDEVCQEFGAWYRGQVPEEVHWSAAEAMADEIVRLRGERDALRYEMHDRMNKLHRVLGDPYGHLTEEVARLSRILAMLKQPSEKILLAAVEAVPYGASYAALQRCLPAAVTAAEQEMSA